MIFKLKACFFHYPYHDPKDDNDKIFWIGGHFCVQEWILKPFQYFTQYSKTSRYTINVSQKNRVSQNRLSWGLLLFSQVSKFKKNRVPWG